MVSDFYKIAKGIILPQAKCVEFAVPFYNAYANHEMLQFTKTSPMPKAPSYNAARASSA